MDRKQQLRNVAFGGAWSEQIAGREALAQAITSIADAARLAAEEDPLSAETMGAVAILCVAHPKGQELERAWRKAGRIENPGVRVRDLERLAGLMASAYGGLKT